MSVGGGGKVALKLASRLSQRYTVHSIIRSDAKNDDVKAAGASPVILSLEDDDAPAFAKVFADSKAVIFSAGSGGKGGPDRTWAVDHRGAVKVFDAISSLPEPRPRLLLVSAIGVRDQSKPAPAHWTAEDKQRMDKSYQALGPYYPAKLAADQDLVKRKDFRWTILRPGGLADEAGTGRVSLGRTTTTRTIPRDDVAAVLAELLERDDASGLALDLVSGDTPIAEAVDAAISRGQTDFAG